jgi:hypothetical protein
MAPAESAGSGQRKPADPRGKPRTAVVQADAERIADEEHADHQFRIDRRTPRRRIAERKRLSDRVEIKNRIYPSQ